MSEQKTFSRSYRFSGETIRKLLEVQQQRDFPSITLALETIIAEAYQVLQVQGSPEEKDQTLEFLLKPLLGDELYERHVQWLEKWKQEGETIEDVFRRFINQAGMNPTKEEWKERVQDGEKVDPFRILEPEKCHYRVIDPHTNKWYCDGKEIVPAVCIGRQERFLFMRQAKGNTKIKCKPKTLKRPSFRKAGSKGTITIPTTTYCYVKKESVSIRETCYNKENPCKSHTYCRSLEYYKNQLEKARLRGQI